MPDLDDDHYEVLAVIRDRSTNAISQKRVPVSASAYPFLAVHPSERVWRYMAIDRFESLLKTSCIYFARGDRFEDPWESRFTGGQRGFSESDKRVFEGFGLSMTFEDAVATHENHRKCIFVSCWHRARRESARMWHEYAKTQESVAVMTTVRTLEKFLPKNILKCAVKYHDDGFARSTVFGYNALAFCKPVSLVWENEFRMVRGLVEGDSVSHVDADKDFGRLVPIKLKRDIDRVITHPLASPDFKNHVDELLKATVPGRWRENSFLNRSEFLAYTPP
jgi:hypothetical protein